MNAFLSSFFCLAVASSFGSGECYLVFVFSWAIPFSVIDVVRTANIAFWAAIYQGCANVQENSSVYCKIAAKIMNEEL